MSSMQQLFERELKTRTQQKGKSLQEFEAEIVRLTSTAFSSASKEFLECTAPSTFIDGIEDY